MKVVATALLALLLAPASLAAQEWPTRSVKIVVPFAPGSTPDMVGRVIAEEKIHGVMSIQRSVFKTV